MQMSRVVAASACVSVFACVCTVYISEVNLCKGSNCQILAFCVACLSVRICVGFFISILGFLKISVPVCVLIFSQEYPRRVGAADNYSKECEC